MRHTLTVAHHFGSAICQCNSVTCAELSERTHRVDVTEIVDSSKLKRNIVVSCSLTQVRYSFLTLAGNGSSVRYVESLPIIKLCFYSYSANEHSQTSRFIHCYATADKAQNRVMILLIWLFIQLHTRYHGQPLQK